MVRLIKQRAERNGASRNRRSATFYVAMLGWIPTAGLLAVLLISLAADTWYLAFGASTLAAMAAFFAGGLLGFLFGVPKASGHDPATETASSGEPKPKVSAPSSVDPANRTSRYIPNTNLEQVSDWLTKVLLGAGLTQIQAIGDFFRSVGESLGEGVGLPGSAMTAVVAFYVVVGFIFFYLWTRLYLPELFGEAERRGRTAEWVASSEE